MARESGIQVVRYWPPINPEVFLEFSGVLLIIGAFLTAWFFVYEVTTTKEMKNIKKEILIALVASIFCGSGVHFLLLDFGIFLY